MPAASTSWATAASPTWSPASSSSACSRLPALAPGTCVRPSDGKVPQAHRLLAVRRLARPAVRQRLLLVGVLHVRHQRGGHRQRARPQRASRPSFSWTCAPLARISTSTMSAPATSTACALCARAWPRWTARPNGTLDVVYQTEDEQPRARSSSTWWCSRWAWSRPRARGS